MPPLWLSILIGILGLGLVELLLGKFYPKLTRGWAILITGILLVFLIIVAQKSVEYPTVPRHLESWQREAMYAGCKEIGTSIWIWVGSPPGNLESEDYSRELMSILDKCHLSATFGYGPFSNWIVLNEGKVVVPVGANYLLRLSGLQLWVLDLKNKPTAALKLSHALDIAGLPFEWRSDIRLSGTAVSGGDRIAITGTQCVLLVGQKPAFNLRFLFVTQKRHLFWMWARVRARWREYYNHGLAFFSDVWM